MRIAHIGPSSLPVDFVRGGAVERRMAELALSQDAAGDEVLVLSTAASNDHERGGRFVGSGVKLIELPCRSRRPVRDLELPLRARKAVRHFAPDVVHAHNNWAVGVAFSGTGLPVVLSLDFHRYRWSGPAVGRAAYSRLLDRFDLILPVSGYCRDEAVTYWGFDPARVRMLPNGVNVEQFRPDAERRAAARARWGVEGGPVVGAVGRVNEQKGSDLLVEAYVELVRTVPSARLLVAGPAGQFGDCGGSLLTDRIHSVGGTWLGAVDESDLADVFRSLDVAVLATREYEMFGMVAAEAMASGTPVVASHHGGLPEVVDRRAGVLVPPGDSTALATALVELCRDDSQRSGLAAAARPSAAGRFSWDRIAELARELYIEAAVARRGALGADR